MRAAGGEEAVGWPGHACCPLRLFPSPTCHLTAQLRQGPRVAAPGPQRGPLAASKNRAGRRWCWVGHDVRGWGQREHASAQSPSGSAWTLPAGFLAGPGGSPATSVARERCSLPGKRRRPSTRKWKKLVISQEIPVHSSASWTSFFLPAFFFFLNKNPEESWVEARGRGSLLMMLLLASGIRAVPVGQVGHFCARRGKDSSVWAWTRSSHDVVMCVLLKGLGH